MLDIKKAVVWLMARVVVIDADQMTRPSASSTRLTSRGAAN